MIVYEKSIIIKEAIARIIPTVKHGEDSQAYGRINVVFGPPIG